LVLQRAWE